MSDTAGKDTTSSSLDSVNKIPCHGVQFYEVDAENEAFIDMITSVEHDLSETGRLLKLESVNTLLMNGSEKLPYVRGVIINTTAALYEIGDWVERARRNEGNSIDTFQTQDRWVFNDCGKLVNQNLDLSTCQQALSNVLAILKPLEKIPPGYDSLPLASELDNATLINTNNNVAAQETTLGSEAGRLSFETSNDPKRLSYPVQPSAICTTVKRKPIPTNRSLPAAPEGPRALTQPQVVGAAFQSFLKPALSTSTIASISNLTLSPNSSMPTSPDDSRSITDMFDPPSPPFEAESECIEPSSSLDDGHRQWSLPAFKKSPPVAPYMSRRSFDSSRTSPNPQTQARVQPKSSQSWPSVAADNPYQNAQQARRVISPRPVYLPSKASDPSLPEALIIGHRSSSSTSILSAALVGNADVYSDDPPSARHHSNSVSMLPTPAQPLRHRNLSSTNLLGPINMFDFSAMKDSLRPRTAGIEESVNRNSLPVPQVPPKVPIKQARSFSNLAEADSSKKITFNVPDTEPVMEKRKMDLKPDLLLKLQPVNYVAKSQFNKPVELPSNIAQPAGAEKESPSKWRTYNRDSSTEPIHTIESSHNPPPEVVGMPVISPRFVKSSLNSWQEPQRQNPEFNPARSVHHEQEQNGLGRDSVVKTDESVHVWHGNQSLLEPSQDDNTSSDTQLKSTGIKMKPPKTAVEIRRQNRRALLNIMNKGSHG